MAFYLYRYLLESSRNVIRLLAFSQHMNKHPSFFNVEYNIIVSQYMGPSTSPSAGPLSNQ